MNIIDAWKAAKVGQSISCGKGSSIKNDNNIFDFISFNDNEEKLLSNEWKVIKEKKVYNFIVKEQSCFINILPCGYGHGHRESFLFKVGDKVTIEREE
jgi:hypothetical protein